jgi:HEPN domain-containing protein
MAREAALEWLAVAEIDLKAARNCLHGPEPTPQAAAYHCQQAAEKLIKAALVAEGVHPPRSHDIGGLAELLPAGHPLRPAFARLERLTVYAIAYRYPPADMLANPPEPAVAAVDAWVALLGKAKTELLKRLEK